MELTEELKEICDNYHFREVLIEGDVKFDYKLHHGPTTTRNAILLLERMGYPEEIIRTANNYLLNEAFRIKDSLNGQSEI